MYIVSGMVPATSTTSATPEILATFEKNSDAHKVLKIFNVLPEEEKFALKGKEIIVEIQENDEEVQKTIKIRNKYTIMYVEEI